MDTDTNSEQTSCSVDNSMDSQIMLDSQQMNDVELNAIKGDSIGDTVYSGKWIINTLISLSKVYEVGWTKTLENDLCFLWDMTVEKDVVTYLMENDFLQIAENCLEISNEPRLTEIILGIIGNMCCQRTTLESLGNNQELVSKILQALLSDDTESIIQIFRILQAAVWDIQKNIESIWIINLRECVFLGETIIFILNSSTNNDLLAAAFNLIFSILHIEVPKSESLLLELFKIENLIPALLEFFLQTIPMQDSNFTQIKLEVIENWLTILSTIMKGEEEKCIDCINNENILKIKDIFLRLLQPYRYLHNLIPIDEKSASCIYHCVEMILWLQRKKMCIILEINSVIATIIYKLESALKENYQDKLESNVKDIIYELVTYLKRYWTEILKLSTVEEITHILNLCEEQIVKDLVDLLVLHCKVSNCKFEKLTEAKTSLQLT